MTTAGEANPGWPAQAQAAWRSACELLEAGQYEGAADLLGEVRAACEPMGGTSLAPILSAARRICLACRQCRAEAEWHQKACREADRRERELKQQLQAILDLVCGDSAVARQEGKKGAISFPVGQMEMPGPDVPEPSDGPSLWKRIQDSFGRRQAPPAGPAKVPVEAPAGIEQEETPPSLVIYCLGPFRVYQDDQLIEDWPSGKGKCIFKYMLANRERPIAKEMLMDLFWRDAGPDAARNNLNVAIYGLRQAFRAGRPDFSHILFQDDCFLLNPAMSVWVDVEEFLGRYEAGRALEKRGKLAEAVPEYEVAEGLYLGDFLEEDLYQDWPIPRRQVLKDSYLVILGRLSQYHLKERRYATCILLCQKILENDNCREEAHRWLMRCYARQGQRNLALRQYHLCVETLQVGLEVPPMATTLALHDRIRRGEAV